MYKKSDTKQFKRLGIKTEQINEQLERFKTGFDFIRLHNAATTEDGIKQVAEEDMERLISLYKQKKGSVSAVKMVPASGSASRMFKVLNNFMATYTESDEDYLKYKQNKEPGSIYSFFEKIKEYPFFAHLREELYKDHLDIDKLLWKNQFKEILTYLLTEKGLDYNHTPKGLIDFHIYQDHIRTAFEEHLVEGALYCNDGKTAHIHFTVSEEHLHKFKALLKKVIKPYEKLLNIAFKVHFSIQKRSTDTISLDAQGNLLRDENGNIVFRPGGHGALIHNLNELKEEVIFIKNIDNVAPDRYKDERVKYKELLGGILLELKEKIYHYMQLLGKRGVTDELLNEIEQFIYQYLGYRPQEGLTFKDRKERINYLKKLLDRPIRVCGMVKNEGEPGGGPFWVGSPEKGYRLMIVESAQVDMKDKEQKKIFSRSGYFNPVDIVCCIYNYKGKKYNLNDFIDHSQGFITTKSLGGEEIQVQELPGLWNGAMANWNTIFVEVPLFTFTPVKTVFDLLRFEHRNVFNMTSHS